MLILVIELIALLEPDILHSPTVENAVLHQGQSLHLGLSAGTLADEEYDRAHGVLDQLPIGCLRMSRAETLPRSARIAGSATANLLGLWATAIGMARASEPEEFFSETNSPSTSYKPSHRAI